MKLRFIFIMVMLLAVPLAAASTVNILPVNETSNEIFFDGTAVFDLRIHNTDNVDRVYTWSSNPVEWIIDSKISSRIDANSSENFELIVRPRPSNYRGPGFYVIPLTVESDNERIETQFTIKILNPDQAQFAYTPSIALGASVEEPVNPMGVVSMQVQLRNRNLLEMDEVQILINGRNFERTDTISLGGLEERSLEYRFDVDPTLQPGEYPLDVRVRFNDRAVSEINTFYEVGQFTRVVRDSNVESRYFKETTVNTLTNNGNVPNVVRTNMSISWYDAVFTSVEVEAQSYDRVERGVYQITLQPQEEARITIVKNYRILPILALITLLVILGYFQFRSPIVMKKQTVVTGQDAEGISEMRVRIFLRNRTAKPFYNVRVIDRAPSIAEVHASGGLGVIEPSKIIKTQKKGTVIKWDFESFEGYEERIVTYTIKARLKIIGNLGLPPTRMKFEDQKGRQRTTQSGKAAIGGR